MGSTTSASFACAMIVRFCHEVVTSDVAMAPEMVRTKFMRPAAEAVSSSLTEPMASPVSGT